MLLTAPIHFISVVVEYMVSEPLGRYRCVVALVTLVTSLSCVSSYVHSEIPLIISPVVAVIAGEPLHLLVYTPDVRTQVTTLCETLLADGTVVFSLPVRVPDYLLRARVLC